MVPSEAGTAFDRFVYERRARAFWELPWPILALVVVETTDEDLDRLCVASEVGRDEYWGVLNAAVRQITGAPA